MAYITFLIIFPVSSLYCISYIAALILLIEMLFWPTLCINISVLPVVLYDADIVVDFVYKTFLPIEPFLVIVTYIAPCLD